jgi:hypothetical protein
MTGGGASQALFEVWLAQLLSSGDWLFVGALVCALVLLAWWVLCTPPDP